MADRIIYLSLALLGGISFCANPQYEQGVWIALVAVSNCLAAALGTKFGLATPEGAGTESESNETK